MKYTIKELPTFSVIGLEQTLTEKRVKIRNAAYRFGRILINS